MTLEEEILLIYKQPLSDILAPLGHQFTDEYRRPNPKYDSFLLSGRSQGVSNLGSMVAPLCEGKRLILRKL